MSMLQPGQRIQLGDGAGWTLQFEGRDLDRIAACVVSARGEVTPCEMGAPGEWRVPAFADGGEKVEILVYITDDRYGGFCNVSYPLSVEIAGQRHVFPAPDQDLAAVVVAEVYTRDGTRRARISNDGFAFGIDAYARARDFRDASFPRRPARGGDSPRERRGAPGETFASGSGVLIGPRLIVTNAHVIEDAARLELGRTREVLTPIAVDHVHDLALLEGGTGDPIPLRLGVPLWLGEGVLAAGYPLMDVLGADLKVTTGNVSGLSGGGGDVSRFQFSAPIGSGSSGGAIIDESGNLVGITSASLAHNNMRERGSSSENVNFGIRCSLVWEMVSAAGLQLPELEHSRNSDRRAVVQRLRSCVVSILVQG